MHGMFPTVPYACCCTICGKLKVGIRCRLQKMQFRNPTMFDKNETLFVIWLDGYRYCHVSCPLTYRLFFRLTFSSERIIIYLFRSSSLSY